MNLNDQTFDSLVLSETDPPLINVGSGQDQSIRELAELVAAQVDSAKAEGAQYLRPLYCLRDFHRRAVSACSGLAGLGAC